MSDAARDYPNNIKSLGVFENPVFENVSRICRRVRCCRCASADNSVSWVSTLEPAHDTLELSPFQFAPGRQDASGKPTVSCLHAPTQLNAQRRRFTTLPAAKGHQRFGRILD